MSATRLKDAYRSYRPMEESEAEKKLLGRSVQEVEQTVNLVGEKAETALGIESASALQDASNVSTATVPRLQQQQGPSGNEGSPQLLTTYQPRSTLSALNPRPVAPPEPTSQMSFRIPLSLAKQFRRIAKFNQLEQQEIIKEVLRHALAELPQPPPDWYE